jgi:tetratricopeptide (TPR) repeat protein
MKKSLTFLMLSLVVLVCGQGVKSVEGSLGTEGGVLKDEGIELEAQSDAIPEGMTVTATVRKTGHLPLPEGYRAGDESITVHPESGVFESPCVLRVRAPGEGYRLALQVPDGAVILADSRKEGDWIVSVITHGGTYVPVHPPESFGVSVPRFHDRALLLIGDIYISDYMERTARYLESKGLDVPICTFLYPTDASIAEGAELLSRELKALHDEHGEFILDVVAFGTGGLILHKYIVDSTLYKKNIGKAVIGVGVPYFGTALADLQAAASVGESWAFGFVDAMGENAKDLIPGSELTEWVRQTRHKAMKNTFKKGEIRENRNTVSLAGVSGLISDLDELSEGDGWVSRSNTMLTYIEPEPFRADHFKLMRDEDMLESLAGFLSLYREYTWPETFSAVWKGDMSLSDAIRVWEREARLTLRIDENFDLLVNYNANMLRSMPENGILVTNGDYDTYPAWYAQKIMGIRTDVAIVNRSLSNVSDFVLYLKSQGLPLDLTVDEIRLLKPKRDEDGILHLPSDSVIRTLCRDHRDRVRLAVTVYSPETFGFPLSLQGLVYALEEGDIDVPETRRLLHEVYDYDPFPGFSMDDVSLSLKGLLFNYIAATWKLTDALKEAGKPDRALGEAEFMEKTLPSEPWGALLKGNVLEEMGRTREAESAYKEALRLGPAAFQAHEALAGFYAAQGERGKAIGVLAGWIAEHPDDAAALDLLDNLRSEGEDE